ncbi:hypothetical protein MRB53_011888 [Persea americana]|uniref:Uncharacterized protein n=1 Tax=Persea americana TaxID=3435 RepID=A0ACC2LW86_PERAE|nr:hypothetical protein MRB53_011888 [Persea americana]
MQGKEKETSSERLDFANSPFLHSIENSNHLIAKKKLSITHYLDRSISYICTHPSHSCLGTGHLLDLFPRLITTSSQLSDLTVLNQSRMEKEGTKIQPRPKEKDLFLNFAVWGLIVWAFVTMSLNIIMLDNLTFAGRSIILARSDVRRLYLYEATSPEILELKVGDETHEIEEDGAMDWNENEVAAKMTRSRKMVLQRSLGSEIAGISKRNG